MSGSYTPREKGGHGHAATPIRAGLSVAGLFWIFLAAGCSPYESHVRGVVTLDGSAVNRGTVTFYPVTTGAAAYAQIDEDGRYEVQTGSEEGLQPGRYKVSVRIVDELAAKSQWDPPRFRTAIPLRYKNPQTSGLECDVAPGKNEYNIELTLDQSG